MVETHLEVSRDKVQINGLEFFFFFSDENEKGIGRNQTGEKEEGESLSYKQIAINRQGERSKSCFIGLHLYLCW